MRLRDLTPLVLPVLTTLLAACGSTSPTAPSSITVSALTVSGTVPAVGAGAQFTATAALSDSTSRPVTAEATWQSSNTAVATVTGGMVTAVAAGEADIIAVYQNVTGRLRITVAPPPAVTAMTVSGTAPALGGVAQFTATASLADGSSRSVTTEAVWQSSNTSVATVSGGLVNAVGAGTADITATYQDVVGGVKISVSASQAGVATIAVEGNAPFAGGSSQFGAVATLVDGTVQNVGSLATWRSSDTAIATVTNGLVKGIAPGDVDIIASYGGATGTTRITVRPVPCSYFVVPVSVSIPAAGGTYTVTLTTSPSGATCNWTATSGAPFVTITGGASGTGSGPVSFAVAPNPDGARSGVLTIAGRQVTVSQAAGNCVTSVSPAHSDFPAEMRQQTVTVTAPAGCQWTVATTTPFIQLPTFVSGNGSGWFTYRVLGNLTGAPRAGTIQVLQHTVSVNQQAANGANHVSFVSDAGDYIGRGWTVLHQVPTSTLTPTIDASRNHLALDIAGSDGLQTMWWRLDLAAPQGQQLAPGTYQNATRYPFQAPSIPGLSFYGDGRGCNTSRGDFTIIELAIAADGSVQRLRATFEQHCEGAGPALRGTVVYAR